MTINKLSAILALIIMLFARNLLASDSSTISGRIADSSGKALAGASVRLENTTLGAVSRKDGRFVIKNVPDGVYSMKVSMMSFEAASKQIKVPSVEQNNCDFQLKESSVQTGAVVVSATRSEKNYDEIPIKISSASDKIFEASESVALRDGLRFQPGLRVEADCQNCGYSQVRLNGLDGRYSQILIDSRPIYTSLNSLYGLDQIPTNMIERVEVIRGGGSSLYSGNAVAGIINIITKEPVDNKVGVNLTQYYIDGTTPEKVIQINSSTVNDKQNSGIYLFGNYRERKPWDANGDGFSESSYIRENSFGARGFYNPDFLSKVKYEVHFMNEYRRGGDQIELPPHEVMMAEDLTHNVLGGSVSYEKFIKNSSFKYSGYLSFSNTERSNYTGIGMDPNGYGNASNIAITGGLQLSNVANDFIAGNSIFTYGLEYNLENADAKATGYGYELDQKVRQFGLYLQDDWTPHPLLNMLIGFRVDKHNLLDYAVFNPRFAMLYHLTSELALRSSVSTGYRAPQAYDNDIHAEMRSGKRIIIKLDNNLKAEESLSFNFSADYNSTIWGALFTLGFESFYAKLTDAFVNIDQGEDSYGNDIYLKKNGSGAEIAGFTLTFSLKPSNVIEIESNFTLQHSEYNQPYQWTLGADGNTPQSTNHYLRTPDIYGSFAVFLNPFDDFEVNLTGIYTGGMYTTHVTGGMKWDGTLQTKDELVHTPDFVELNTKISYVLIDSYDLKFNIGVLNIFNSFQSDFDLGANRDTNYIYGPLKPRTFVCGVEAGF